MTAFGETSIPPLVNQVGDLGTWEAAQANQITGFMHWRGHDGALDNDPDTTKDRLVDQPHDTGTWRVGPGQAMTWTPTPTDTTE